LTQSPPALPTPPKIHPSWLEVLRDEFEQEYFAQLKRFLQEEKRNHVVYPPGPLIFNAFDLTPFDKVRVVVVGQDPYHGQGQAHGLSFSVPDGVPPPPSLVNIFKEQERDLGISPRRGGNLEGWARQGVFLINATLTVRAEQAASHQGRGWERFTDRVIEALAQGREGLVFMLWGRSAQNKAAMAKGRGHLVLEAPHPSPLSAHRGFLGCGHFSKANEFLRQRGQPPIDWGA